MYTSKFFTFTVEGDKLDVMELNDNINLDNVTLGKKSMRISKECYNKEDTTLLCSGKTFVQKTNRWVYSAEAQNHTTVGYFLTKNLEFIASKLDVLKPFVKKNKTYIDLTIYIEEKTSIKLMKKQIELLHKIGVDDIAIEFVLESTLDKLFNND